MKKTINKKWMGLFAGLTLAAASAPILVAASCGSSTTNSATTDTSKQVTAPTIDLSKTVMSGSTSAITLAYNDAGVTFKDNQILDASGKETGLEVYIKYEGSLGKGVSVNTNYMPVELMNLYLSGFLKYTLTPSETSSGSYQKISDVYGDNFGFTDANISLPTFEQAVISKNQFKIKVSAKPGYKITNESTLTEVKPVLDSALLESVNLFVPKNKEQAMQLLNGLLWTANSDIIGPNDIVYGVRTALAVPLEWQTYVDSMTFSATPTTKYGAASGFSASRPSRLQSNIDERVFLVKFVPKPGYAFISGAVDYYNLLAHLQNARSALSGGRPAEYVNPEQDAIFWTQVNDYWNN